MILSVKRSDARMWKEEQKHGFKYIERYLDPLTGKQKKVSITLNGKYTKKQEELAREILKEKINSKYDITTGDSLTLEEVASYYFQDQKRTVSEQTYIRNYHAIRSIMKMLGSDVLIDKLTARYVRERFNASGKANGTLNEHLTRLKAFLRWAYRNDYVNDIAWIDKLQPYQNEEKKAELKEKYLEADDLTKLLNGMTVKKWHDLTQFLALTGMRCGEALGLLTEDVDTENRVIHVCASLSSVTGKRGATKTRAERDVYMQDELLTLCKRLLLEQKKRDFETGIRSAYFFHDLDGSPLEYYAFNKYLEENAAIFLPERKYHTTTHILRHTHVALMAESGVSLDAISRRLGHADSKITKEVYFHVTKKMRERDNAEFEKVVLLAK